MDFDEKNILETFDRLVNLDIIKFGDSTAFPFNEDGFEFEIRICPAWSKKPLTVDHGHDPDSATESFGPASDIRKSHPDQVIGYIYNTHIVALNIYPVFRPQYMLLNIDSTRSQNEPLSREDIAASWDFIHAIDSPMYIMYNCTQTAGCSRHHKHTQVVPLPQTHSDCRFFPDAPGDKIRVPYRYFLHRFDKAQPPSADEVFLIYRDLLAKCKEVLRIDVKDETTLCPHNVAIVKEWILLIPRGKGNFNGLMANTAGMLGMPTVTLPEIYELWRQEGPFRVLSELGVANPES
ncbi:Fc.00g031440.m01.CDS01 [Cosmosporella sp. VM-42]